jgi:hypothetical protein
MAQQTETFEGYCVLELMGHRKLAGMVREVTIAGAGFLRLDVPGEQGAVATQYYPPSSVYCISPCSEDIARRYAQHNQPQPVTRYELPAPAETRAPIARDVEADDYAARYADEVEPWKDDEVDEADEMTAEIEAEGQERFSEFYD